MKAAQESFEPPDKDKKYVILVDPAVSEPEPRPLKCVNLLLFTLTRFTDSARRNK